MKIFVETVDLDVIGGLLDTDLVDGIVDGIVAGPPVVSGPRHELSDAVGRIAPLVSGPVIAVVSAGDFEAMMVEAGELTRIGEGVGIAVPPTPEGLKICRTVSGRGVVAVVTPCFTAAQALLAAKAGRCLFRLWRLRGRPTAGRTCRSSRAFARFTNAVPCSGP